MHPLRAFFITLAIRERYQGEITASSLRVRGASSESQRGFAHKSPDEDCKDWRN